MSQRAKQLQLVRLLTAVFAGITCLLCAGQGKAELAAGAFAVCVLSLHMHWVWSAASRKRPEVLLDVDGVIADFLRDALPIIQGVLGKKYVPEDFHTWDIFEVIGKEHEELCWKHINVKGFYQNLSPYFGATEGVNQLKKVAEIHIVTAMASVHSEHAYYERAEWIQKYLDMTEHDVTFSSKKEKISGDVLVDDKISNVVAWARSHPNGVGLIWDQPYNRQCSNLPRNVRRVFSWDEVIKIVEAL